MADNPVRKTRQTKRGCEDDGCKRLAWKAYCEGIYSWRGIAVYVNEKQGCGHDHNWAKRAVEGRSKEVAEIVNSGAIDHLAEYLSGLRADLTSQQAIATDQGNPAQVRSMARERVTKIREKMAAAQGVITERSATQQSGTVDVNHVSTYSDETLERMREDVNRKEDDPA